MKKLFLSCIVALFAICSSAQDVTTFLGIPVDGYKSEMREKLMEKGFTPKKIAGGQECFTGEFNGMDVEIHIVTNNNKVYRLMVCDAHTTNEAGIKIRFNNLVYQFQNNIRYETIGSEDQTISDNEDISYGMTFQAKNYDALFYQKPIVELDSVELKSLVKERLYSMLTEEQLKDTVSGAYSELISAMAQYVALELRTQKLVWFRIIKDYDQYYIAMYYDNKYNEANGEDL